ncbi:SDR family oxidoreductase [Taibaiella koreensis]|uniref:SDR family oxidoreductase n=1 Tax=Taibaiella koreensis TaxID=1268548 RepID=UPI000E599AF0|nr:SDR family oxidoreductase [Taibaiella koreensis]
MRVFVTGASGFVGSAIVKELLQAGHQVLGMVRSDQAAGALIQAGAEAHPGNLNDPDSLIAGAASCDAVIHTAFNHDFSRFKANCEDDRKVIETLGKALAGSQRPLLITSGVGVLRSDRLVTELDEPPGSDLVPRAATEEAAQAAAGEGVNTYIVRLPPSVHGAGDHGFVPMVMGMAREQKVSAYIGEGANRWPAVHRLDAAILYRLVVEKQPQQRVYHAVAEEGIPFRDIASVIGQRLQLPTESRTGADAEAHFGWFHHFAAMDCPASAAQSMVTLGWTPEQPGLIAELASGVYD